MALLTERAFRDLLKVLEISEPMNSNDPDRRVIEKAFRKLALKTHPDKGGDPVKFKRINDAYNRLIDHVSKLEILESDKDLASNSVIIEISKQAVKKWIERLRIYGTPRTSNLKTALFEGAYKHYKGRSRSLGALAVTLYEDPQDSIPKLHIRCENYMLWITEQKLPLHLHVGKEKKISFDQWRIMNVAEFGFVSSSVISKGASCVSAYNQWSEEFENLRRQKSDQEDSEAQERKRAEEMAAKEEAERLAAEEARRKAEAEEQKKREDDLRPWWKVYADKYNISETTPPPEEDDQAMQNPAGFPDVYSMTSNSYGIPSNNSEPQETPQDKTQESTPHTSRKEESLPEEEPSKKYPKVEKPSSSPKSDEVPKESSLKTSGRGEAVNDSEKPQIHPYSMSESLSEKIDPLITSKSKNISSESESTLDSSSKTNKIHSDSSGNSNNPAKSVNSQHSEPDSPKQGHISDPLKPFNKREASQTKEPSLSDPPLKKSSSYQEEEMTKTHLSPPSPSRPKPKKKKTTDSSPSKKENDKSPKSKNSVKKSSDKIKKTKSEESEPISHKIRSKDNLSTEKAQEEQLTEKRVLLEDKLPDNEKSQAEDEYNRSEATKSKISMKSSMQKGSPVPKRSSIKDTSPFFEKSPVPEVSNKQSWKEKSPAANKSTLREKSPFLQKPPVPLATSIQQQVKERSPIPKNSTLREKSPFLQKPPVPSSSFDKTSNPQPGKERSPVPKKSSLREKSPFLQKPPVPTFEKTSNPHQSKERSPLPQRPPPSPKPFKSSREPPPGLDRTSFQQSDPLKQLPPKSPKVDECPNRVHSRRGSRVVSPFTTSSSESLSSSRASRRDESGVRRRTSLDILGNTQSIPSTRSLHSSSEFLSSGLRSSLLPNAESGRKSSLTSGSRYRSGSETRIPPNVLRRSSVASMQPESGRKSSRKFERDFLGLLLEFSDSNVSLLGALRALGSSTAALLNNLRY